MPTLLCVPIMVQDAASALAEAAAAKEAGADLVEYRVDEVFHGEGDDAGESLVVGVVADSPLPCIVTCRPVWEGGHYDGDDPARISLYERLGTAFGEGEEPPRYLDVELATYTRSANIRQKINLAVEHPEQLRDVRTSLIVSVHDFQGRPADLSRKLLRLRDEPAAKVHKIAYRARSLRDNLELFDLLEERDRPTIALGMGEFGLMSRVLAPKFGGFLTFASLRGQSATAPGQPTVRDLLDLYRFRSIGPATAVYGVVGWPVGHSLSPHVHNAGFEAVGHDGVYLPLPVQAADGGEGSYESFKATMGELIEHERLGLGGCSVTIPHKENLVRLARELGWSIDETSERIGAANTLAVERDESGAVRTVRIANTDAPALADSLEEVLGPPAGKRIAVLGAGGAGRAAAAVLMARGAAVTVFNRSRPRAERLAEDLSPFADGGMVAAADWEALPDFRGDAFVNTTPVGMSSGPDPAGTPIAAEALKACDPGTVVMDAVYNPVRTRLLVQATAEGLRTVDGVGMFVRQAAAQFAAWTGRAAPTGLFDRIVREQLGA